MITIHAMPPDHQHRAAPVVAGDDPARQRRDEHRAESHARRDQCHGQAAVDGEPTRHRRGHRRIDATHSQPDSDAEQELELP